VQLRFYPCFQSSTVLKLRTRAEGWTGCEWTCRKPRQRTRDGSLTRHSITGTSLVALDAIRKRPIVNPKFQLNSLPTTAERWARPRERSTPRAQPCLFIWLGKGSRILARGEGRACREFTIAHSRRQQPASRASGPELMAEK